MFLWITNSYNKNCIHHVEELRCTSDVTLRVWVHLKLWLTFSISLVCTTNSTIWTTFAAIGTRLFGLVRVYCSWISSAHGTIYTLSLFSPFEVPLGITLSFRLDLQFTLQLINLHYKENHLRSQLHSTLQSSCMIPGKFKTSTSTLMCPLSLSWQWAQDL